MEEGERLLNPKEVADILSVPVAWVYDHSTGRRRPRLRAIKLGKVRRFLPEHVEEFMKRVLPNEGGTKVVNSVPARNLKGIGLHLSRPRSQHGQLSAKMPGRGKLARGRYWGLWRIRIPQPDGSDIERRVGKIIDRGLADQMGFVLDYSGPLRKSDAREVLQKLIGESNAAPAAYTTKTTFGELAREYIDLNKPNWEASTNRVNVQIIEDHLIAKLGSRRVRDLSQPELQRFINAYVENEASRSLLGKLGLFLRAILNAAADRGLIQHIPARKLRAKSRRRPCNLVHTLEECDLLLAQVSGADHLAVRLLIQLGLRSEELFALRQKDVQGSELVIDEAIVDGQAKDTKTVASAAPMYLTPDLELEVRHYLRTLPEEPDGWLFPSTRKGVPTRPGNFLNRVLKPAAVRAGLAVRDLSKGKQTSAVNFQSLRRTAATLFGAKAKDPRSTQAHMRHTDPHVTLRHYQREIPAEVKAAAIALEQDLLEQKRRREEALKSSGGNLLVV
jgi:integrase